MQPDEVLDYPLPGRIPGRGALWARFGEGDTRSIVVIAHLSLGPDGAHAPARLHRRLLGHHPNVVLMGDLNTPPASAELKMLYSKTSLEPSHESPATFPSWRPTRAIDHILVSGSIEVERRWALPHPVSDHLPVAASIVLPATVGAARKQAA